MIFILLLGSILALFLALAIRHARRNFLNLEEPIKLDLLQDENWQRARRADRRLRGLARIL